jgi:hydroxyethylthiazole kinase-like uncharacterized protein yjeF
MDLRYALLDVHAMTEADRLTVASGISAIELMQNAGRTVVDEIVKRWSVRNVTVLCGPGNNGGDGFVIARRLAEWNWPVRVALLGSLERLKGEARFHAQQWTGVIEPWGRDCLGGAELIVDAVFGAGLSRPLDATVREVLDAAVGTNSPIVAVDVPSGVMGDTGQSLGAVACVLTVTFFRKKPGHLLQPGRRLCGDVVVTEIDTPLSVFESIEIAGYENSPTHWLAELPQSAALIDDSSQADAECQNAVWQMESSGSNAQVQILTPDEMQQLRGMYDCSLALVKAESRQRGAVVVATEPDTVIASADGCALIDLDADSSLNSATARDELRRRIQGLLERGIPPFLAAAAAVWIRAKNDL